MLGDILFSTHCLFSGTNLVTTFSVGDNHAILRVYLACGPKQKNEHAFLFCLL